MDRKIDVELSETDLLVIQYALSRQYWGSFKPTVFRKITDNLTSIIEFGVYKDEPIKPPPIDTRPCKCNTMYSGCKHWAEECPNPEGGCNIPQPCQANNCKWK